MRVAKVEPAYRTASNGYVTVAHFDLQVVDGIRIKSVHLVTRPDGTETIFSTAPHSTHRTATFRRDVADSVIAMVNAELLRTR